MILYGFIGTNLSVGAGNLSLFYENLPKFYHDGETFSYWARSDFNNSIHGDSLIYPDSFPKKQPDNFNWLFCLFIEGWGTEQSAVFLESDIVHSYMEHIDGEYIPIQSDPFPTFLIWRADLLEGPNYRSEHLGLSYSLSYINSFRSLNPQYMLGMMADLILDWNF